MKMRKKEPSPSPTAASSRRASPSETGREEKPEEGIEVRPASIFEKGTEIKIRKNALQIKKETEEAEKEFLAKEQIWEAPAFLRKQQKA